MRPTIAFLVTAISSLFLTAGAAHAQLPAYPAKPIRLILPFPPGGPSDILRRALSQKLAEQLGQQVLADNRPGAGGNLEMEVAAKSPPDGYTVVLRSPTMAISPSLYKKLIRLAANGIEPVTSTPDEFASFVRSETVRYAKVIREAKISID